MKKPVISACVLIAFAIRLWRGFAPPVIVPGDMASGAMNDPFAVVISAVMAAVVVWGGLSLLFWLGAKMRK